MKRKNKNIYIKFLILLFFIIFVPFIVMAIYMNYSYYMPKIQNQRYLDNEYKNLKEEIKRLDDKIQEVEIEEATPVSFHIDVIYKNKINQSDIDKNIIKQIYQIADREKNNINDEHMKRKKETLGLSTLSVSIYIEGERTLIDSYLIEFDIPHS